MPQVLRFTRPAAFVAICLMVQATNVLGHPFHATLAEVEFNAESKCLEVALRVSAFDLERALRKRTGRPVDLEKTGDADALTTEYLRKVFVVTKGDGQPAGLTCVGKEFEGKNLWLYLEFALPNGLTGVRLSNAAFFELESDQVNTVNLTIANSKHTLRLTRKEASKPLLPAVTQ